MHILLTSAASPLTRYLADALAADHAVRLTERVHVETEHEFAKSPLDHDGSTNLLVRGTDAIVHVAEPLPDEDAHAQIDYTTRCTYNLLMAAHEEGVPRVVLISTLELLAGYDERYIVDERWRPLPTTEPSILAKHLGEFTCREFARERKVSVVTLRLAPVAYPDDANTDPTAVAAPVVAQAVNAALTAETRPWAIFHIAPDVPHPHFPATLAKQELGIY